MFDCNFVHVILSICVVNCNEHHAWRIQIIQISSNHHLPCPSPLRPLPQRLPPIRPQPSIITRKLCPMLWHHHYHRFPMKLHYQVCVFYFVFIILLFSYNYVMFFEEVHWDGQQTKVAVFIEINARLIITYLQFTIYFYREYDFSIL